MNVYDCVKCGDKTTNRRTKICDTCNIKRIIRKQILKRKFKL